MHSRYRNKGLLWCLAVLLIIPALTSTGRNKDFEDLPKEIQAKILAHEYEDPERAEWQKVEDIIAYMSVKEGDRIADIGGGTGYFTRPFAKHVGPSGIVYCCDINEGLLEYAQKKAKEEGLNNIVTVYAAPDRPMLAPQSVDLLFFCNVHHHLDDPAQYYRDMKPLLKPGGSAIIVIWKKILNEDRSERYLYKDVLESMKSAGWRLIRENRTLVEKQEILIFQPKSNE